MTGYTKLFGSIINSTVWCAPDRHRIVWITLLAMADMDGVVDSSIPGLAKIAAVPVEDVQEALAAFKGPDEFSRTPDFDGRRLEDYNDGHRSGWVLLNHGKYRAVRDKEERKAYNRKWMAEKRATQKSTVDDCGQSGPPLANPAPAPALNKSKAGARGARLPQDWEPSEELKAYAASKQVDWKIELEAFRDWWKASPKGTKLDWDATWRTWVRRATPTLSKAATQPMGAKAALKRTETPLESDLAYIRQQWTMGAYGDGPEALTKRDELMAEATEKRRNSPRETSQ